MSNEKYQSEFMQDKHDSFEDKIIADYHELNNRLNSTLEKISKRRSKQNK